MTTSPASPARSAWCTDGSIDYDLFVEHSSVYGGRVTDAAEIPHRVRPEAARRRRAHRSRMKAAGVTTIVPFAELRRGEVLMEVASQQDYFPEWFFTGASYQDIGILARSYPPDSRGTRSASRSSTRGRAGPGHRGCR